MKRHTILFISLAVFVSTIACNSNDKVESKATPEVQTDTISILEDLLNKDTTNIEVRTELAQRYYAANNLGEAAYHLMRVYELDNKNLNALIDLGNIYYDGRQSEKAIFFYEKALEIEPDNIDVRCDLATCYSDLNEMKKSIALLRGNIKLNPTHEKSHYNLSVILQKNGNKKEAQEEMKIYESLASRNK